jgi:uncharacterized protein (DUF2235 family)
MVLPRDLAGHPQLAWYDEGVGSTWYERLPGGLLGTGLDLNIQQGYKWLSQRYREGDKVFLFGFSRGAYTARSLVGLIRKCGLLHPTVLDDEDYLRPHEDLIKQAYQLYRRRDAQPDTPESVQFRCDNSREVRINMMGVFDTVGSLGVPSSFERLLEGAGLDTLSMWLDRTIQERYRFHDASLSSIVDNAFHALAIDEHREVFQPTLWDPHSGRHLQQIWFPGAHSDVGGGYPERTVANQPLDWMRCRARECGLHLETRYLPQPLTGFEEIHDSWNHAPYNFRPRAWRTVSAEALHPSTWDRLRLNPGYRPANPGLETVLASLAPPSEDGSRN